MDWNGYYSVGLWEDRCRVELLKILFLDRLVFGSVIEMGGVIVEMVRGEDECF